MSSPPVFRNRLPHALLQALAIEAMEPKELRAHGKLFGDPHAVWMAIERLRARGFIKVEAKITEKGRRHLKGCSK